MLQMARSEPLNRVGVPRLESRVAAAPWHRQLDCKAKLEARHVAANIIKLRPLQGKLGRAFQA
jgi:hypothetical protein